MRIVIAGGSGLLGKALTAAWTADGHEVAILTRSLPPGATSGAGTAGSAVSRVGWEPDGTAGPWQAALAGADAVVNLAGAGLADHRWTDARKALIRDSRLQATRSLVAALATLERRPEVLISASAVGYYGPSGDEPLTETSPPGDDVLATLCQAWEAEARLAEQLSMRVSLIRTGIVIDRSGGALPPMLTPFRFFVGGRIGSGRQFMSWIHHRDWVELVRWVLATPAAGGAINATAPEPVSNRDFARSLGRALGRPALVPAPALALKILLGEMAGPLVLTGQRVLPARALALGYRFQYTDLDAALADVLGTERPR